MSTPPGRPGTPGNGPGPVALIPRDFFARPSVPVAPELLGCVIEHQTAAGLVAVELTEVEAYAGASDPASHAYRGKTARNAVMFGPPGHAYVYFTYGMHFCVNLVCLGNGSASAVLLRAGRVIEGEELARARRARGPRGYGKAGSPSQGGPGGPGGDGGTGSPPVWADSPAGERGRGGLEGIVPTGKTKPGGLRGDGSPWEKTALSFRDLARGPARLCQALDIDRSLDGADVCVADSPLRMRWPSGRTTVRSAVRNVASGPRVGVSSAAEVPWRFWIEGEPTVSAYRRGVRGGGTPPVHGDSQGESGGMGPPAGHASSPRGNSVTP
jgi:DNA-3-methyladenine glycosylase